MRVRFDSFFNEKSLYESGAVEQIVRELVGGDHVYESEGALWLATSKFGDDKDRVLVKSDGAYTYMAPDLAYHRDKWVRGFRTAVDVLGADHAGYPPRIRSGLVALGLPREFLDVELVRLVKLVREGGESPCSPRDALELFGSAPVSMLVMGPYVLTRPRPDAAAERDR